MLMNDTLTLDPLVLEVRAGLARRRQTQDALAKHLEISRNAIVARLSGKVPFSHSELREVATFLGVTVGSLYGEAAA